MKNNTNFYNLLIENKLLSPYGTAPIHFTNEYIDDMINFIKKYSNLYNANINAILNEKKKSEEIPDYPSEENIRNETRSILDSLRSNNSDNRYKDLIQYLENISDQTYKFVYQSAIKTATDYNGLLTKEQILALNKAVRQQYIFGINNLTL